MGAEYRKPYEFSKQTKYEALERADNSCDRCGKPRSEKDYYNLHHTIAIWWAIETKCLAAEVISSIVNAEYLCPTCHKEIHQQESRAYYEELAPIVLAAYLSTKVDHTKDRWRYDRNPNPNPRRSKASHH